MTPPARYAPWVHELAPVASSRVAVMFREHNVVTEAAQVVEREADLLRLRVNRGVAAALRLGDALALRDIGGPESLAFVDRIEHSTVTARCSSPLTTDKRAALLMPEIVRNGRRIPIHEILPRVASPAPLSSLLSPYVPRRGEQEVECVVVNEWGLHARPMQRLLGLIAAYGACDVRFVADGHATHIYSPGRPPSLLGAVALGLHCGRRFRIAAHGPGASALLELLSRMVATYADAPGDHLPDQRPRDQYQQQKRSADALTGASS